MVKTLTTISLSQEFHYLFNGQIFDHHFISREFYSKLEGQTLSYHILMGVLMSNEGRLRFFFIPLPDSTFKTGQLNSSNSPKHNK